MSELLLGFGLNGLLFSLGLAALAAAVQATGKRPMLSHLLWILVLVKLLTPAFVAVPGIALPTLGLGAGQVLADASADAQAALGALHGSSRLDAAYPAGLEATQEGAAEPLAAAAPSWPIVVAWIWLTGSALVLLGSLLRVLRFRIALARASAPAPAAVQQLAERLATRFGIRRMPQVLIAHAQVPPLVWWIGGRPRLVLPAALCQSGKANELRWSLAHELGHIRRGDHMVRWLEWLAVVGFWWNPVAWWARRNLRINEEICCDRLVLATLRPHPKTYASSLLDVVETLATPGLRPPAFASAMNSGDALETRLKMILKNNHSSSTPRWMRAMSLAAAVALLPLGFAQGQERERSARERAEAATQEPERKITKQEYESIAKRLKGMVEAGELSADEAERRLQKLKLQVATQQREVPNTDRNQQRAVREEYLRMERELMALVAAGRISETDAKERLAGFRRSLVEGRESAEAGRAAAEDYKRAAAQLEALVEAGRLSRTDADERLIAMRREMDAGSSAKRAEQTREAYAKRVAELNALVEAGRMSHQEALQALEDMRRKTEEAGQEPARAERRGISVGDYGRAAIEMQKLVDAGRISQSDAEKRLAEMRKRVVADGGGVGRREQVRATRDDHYARFEAEMKELVEAGRLTPEQAQVRLEQLREQMAKSEADEARAQAMDQEAEKIMQAVRAGRLNEEDAKKKLEAMRRGLVEREKKADSRAAGITVEQYRKIAAKVDAAVEAGQISKEDGEKRKIEARKLIRDK